MNEEYGRRDAAPGGPSGWLRAFLWPREREMRTAGPPLGASTVLISLSLPAAFLVLAVIANATAGATFYEISREPTVTLGGPPLTGIQSNIGVLVMWAAAVVCLFAYAVLRREGADRRVARFFLWAGLLTALLTVDDLFLLHDDIIWHVMGLSERWTLSLYALAVAVFAWTYRRTIIASGGTLLILGIVLLAGSMAVDQTSFLWGGSPWRIFVEDGLKLVGLACWSAFFLRRSFYAIVAAAKLEAAP